VASIKITAAPTGPANNSQAKRQLSYLSNIQPATIGSAIAPITTLFDEQVLIEDWRSEENQRPPHSALNYQPPALYFNYIFNFHNKLYDSVKYYSTLINYMLMATCQ